MASQATPPQPAGNSRTQHPAPSRPRVLSAPPLYRIRSTTGSLPPLPVHARCGPLPSPAGARSAVGRLMRHILRSSPLQRHRPPPPYGSTAGPVGYFSYLDSNTAAIARRSSALITPPIENAGNMRICLARMVPQSIARTEAHWLANVVPNGRP